MKWNQTKRQIAGVMALALLVLTIAWIAVGCGQSASTLATTPAGTVSTITTTEPEAQETSVRNIPELIPEPSTMVLEIQTGPALKGSHNLLEE